MKESTPCILGLIAFRMPQLDSWEQPKENSIAALQHGMEFSDGVEFDLRIGRDGELVIYHDEFVPGRGPMKERCIEMLTSEELGSRDITRLDDLLSSRSFIEKWQEGGKTVDIEFKVPHPVTRIDVDSHLVSLMEKLEGALEGLELPKRSTIVSSFCPRLIPVAKSYGFSTPITRLMPRIRPWGRYWKVKRTVAMPHFARTSVPRIANYLRKNDLEVMGMALEYLEGWTRWINPGPPVGLRGRQLERLHKALRGMGAFVWPAPIEVEEALINAGISVVSDHMDPDVISKPDGSLRWPRPASQPLDEGWRRRLNSVNNEERADLLREATVSVPSWAELGTKRRSEIVREQGRRMLWEGSEESWARDAMEGIPWGSPRIIGHRGAGKTHSA